MYASVELTDCDTSTKEDLFASACLAVCKDNPNQTPITICSMEGVENLCSLGAFRFY